MKYSVLVFCLLCTAASFAVEEREAFNSYIHFTGTGTIDVVTVPQGKRLVLLQFSTTNLGFQLLTSEKLLFKGAIFYNGVPGCGISHDFPDRCVVVESGQILKAKCAYYNGDGSDILLVGYYYNTGCTSMPVGDLDGNCRVDMVDFAKMACNWMVDNNA